MKVSEIIQVQEGWKNTVMKGAIGAAALGGIGAVIVNSPMTHVDGKQLQIALPSTPIPSDAKLVTDDNGKKIYMWRAKWGNKMGQTALMYRPASDKDSK